MDVSASGARPWSGLLDANNWEEMDYFSKPADFSRDPLSCRTAATPSGTFSLRTQSAALRRTLCTSVK